MLSISKVIFLVFLISTIGLGQSTWTKKPTGTSKALWGVKFRTETDGWAVGSKGVIVHTTDAGESWKEDSVEYKGTKPLLFFVEPQDSLNIWAGCSSEPWFRSTDGGSTWTSRWIDSVANISRVVFLNPNLAFAAGMELSGDYSGRILRSSDRGETWQVVLDASHRGFYDICFFDSLTGMAVGAKTPVLDNFDPPTAYRTVDGGLSWSEVSVPGSGPLARVSLATRGTVWAGGDNGRLLLTTDSGSSWTGVSPSFPGSWVSSIVATGPSEVWATSVASDVIFHSTDNGITWTPVPFPAGTKISGLSFLNAHHGWAAGDSGAVWKYNFVTSARDVSEPPFSHLRLQPNYPNPFNPSTTITFSLSHTTFVTLSVFDVLGRAIATLANSYYGPGEHQVVFDGENLPSGTYLYALRTQDHVLTGKMILSK